MNYSDEELIKAIIGGGPSLNKVMGYLYTQRQYKDAILNWLIQKGASNEDAEDVFQDGIKHFIINVRKGQFKGDSTVKTYLTRICTNLWFTKLRRQNQLQSIKEQVEVVEERESSPEDLLFTQEKTDLIQQILASLGPLCQKILGLWTLNFKMKEIAQQMGYKSEGMARKKKHQCFQKLMLYLKEKPELADTLLQFYQSK